MDIDLSRSLREAAQMAAAVSDPPAPEPLRRQIRRRRTMTAAARGGAGLAVATVVALGGVQLAGRWDPDPVPPSVLSERVVLPLGVVPTDVVDRGEDLRAK